MRHRGVLVAMGVLVSACASKATPSGPCQVRTGTYTVDLTQRDGTCGRISEQVVTFDSDGNAPTPAIMCTAKTSVSNDKCTVTLTQTCPEAAACKGCTSRFTGSVTWDPSGNSGSGLFDVTAYDASMAITCHSTYDVNYTKH